MNKVRICSLVAVALTVLLHPVLAQSRSAKRGVCWDEKSRHFTAADIERLSAGVSWMYNWGVAPEEDLAELGPDGGMAFLPMCWNGGFNEQKLRDYLSAHPGTEWLLGFNEPNFSNQANMTPEKAAERWPVLEQIADDFGLKLVAPALNFTGSKVGGRLYQPYEWLDAFFEALPEARVDAFALHCYMDDPNATRWFAADYLYNDLFDESKPDVYGHYPHLAAYLEQHGPLPMFLTEFCAWENVSSVDEQINLMTRKLQLLEQSDAIAGYAWFMANGQASGYPYFSIYQTKATDSPLSELGQVYVYSSSFDRSHWHAVGTLIPAKDYVDASVGGSTALQLRSTTDEESKAVVPIEISSFPSSGTADYQVEVPAEGSYRLSLRMALSAESTRVRVRLDGETLTTETIEGTADVWTTYITDLTLPAGRHTLQLLNFRQPAFRLAWLRIDATSGITEAACSSAPVSTEHYTLQGIRGTGDSYRGVILEKTVYDDGHSDVRKVLR